MMEKIDVNGDDRHPVYEELTAVPDADGEAGDIQWNFEKFLVSRDGDDPPAVPADGGPRGTRGHRRHRGQPAGLSGTRTGRHRGRRPAVARTKGTDARQRANHEPAVDHLVEVWTSLATACDRIGAGQWDLATDCPGWTVRDQVSHLIGVERMLLGEPPPPPGRLPDHVRNAFAELNEPWVEARRRVPGNEVLAEFIVGDRPADPRTARPCPPSGSTCSAGARWARSPTATSWPPGSSTAGPTNRTCAGRSGARAAATAWASRRCSTGASAPCPSWSGKRVAPPDGTACGSW